MRESEAWCILAMLCESPLVGGGYYIEIAKGIWIGGLCSLIAQHGVVWEFPPVGDLYDRMDQHCPKNAQRDSWWWPHTEAGWKQRVNFCWRMARLADKEGK